MGASLANDSDSSANTAWSVSTLRDHVLSLITANDRRYSEEVASLRSLVTITEAHAKDRDELSHRAVEVAFESQQRAIDTAFIAQQTGLNAALLAQKEAVATALVAAEKAVNAALVSSAQAVQKAEAAAERRFESVNEFRETLGDQQRMLMPRAEVDVLMKMANEKIDVLSLSFRDQQSKHSGMSSGWALAVGVVGFVALILSVLGFLFRK